MSDNEAVDAVRASGSTAATGMRVLSVQSHVVSGYVGNKAAVFPLQLGGIDVDVVNTVQFSNHTGYEKGWEGERVSGECVEALLQGLVRNDLVRNVTHVLTGYIGKAEVLHCIPRMLSAARDSGHPVTYLCDPVMGDNGSLYVSEDVVEVYRHEITPLADIITPNQFEAEILSNVSIGSDSDAVRACNVLHDTGIRVVLITSTFYAGDENIVLIGSERKASGEYERFKIPMKRMKPYVSGTGDLFAALFLLYSSQHPDSVKRAVEMAVSVVQAVLRRTVSLGARELCIIQSRADIDAPTLTVRSEPL